jgi:outer membrane protein
MKRILILIPAILLSGLLLQAQTKVGWTNVELIMTYMPQTKAIEKELEGLEKKLGEQLEVKQRYYQQKMLEYMEAKEKGIITPELDAVAIKELGKLEAEVQNGLKLAQEALMKKRMSMLQPLQTAIQAAIDAVAKEGGYTYILNNSVGAGVPSILYGQESEDITIKIAKKLGIQVNTD